MKGTIKRNSVILLAKRLRLPFVISVQLLAQEKRLECLECTTSGSMEPEKLHLHFSAPNKENAIHFLVQLRNWNFIWFFGIDSIFLELKALFYPIVANKNVSLLSQFSRSSSGFSCTISSAGIVGLTFGVSKPWLFCGLTSDTNPGFVAPYIDIRDPFSALTNLPRSSFYLRLEFNWRISFICKYY